MEENKETQIIDFRRDDKSKTDIKQLQKFIGKELPHYGTIRVWAIEPRGDQYEALYGSGFNMYKLSKYSRRTRPAVSTESHINPFDFTVTVLGTTCIANNIDYQDLIKMIEDRKCQIS